jgi:AcrR family transcriptional regulator
MPTPDNDDTSRQRERSDSTRARIVQAARELVLEKGYDSVSTGEVLLRANVSRGGMYHHFDGKDQLMAAVLEAVERDLIGRLQAGVADQPDPFSVLSSGAQWFLDECVRSTELQRIGLHEGRGALGWEAWRETVAPYGLTLLANVLAAASEAGQIRAADSTVLAHLILAALHEASAIILSAEDRDGERARVGDAIAILIDGLRVE